MSKKYCIHCGKQINEQDRVCPFCHYDQQTNQPDSNHQADQARSTRSTDNQGYTTTSNHSAQPQYSTIIKRRITPPKRTFTDAFKLFWKNYANFSGYSTRAEFWWWFLIEYIINAVFMSIECNSIIAVFSGEESPSSALSGLTLLMLWWLIILIPNLSLRTRRFRDAGVSTGWTVAILIIDYVPAVIPLLGWFVTFCCRIATLIIECMPSKRTVVKN